MTITDTKTIQEYYDALITRKASYVGVFFVGVKTTSIFCISTCHARKPKFENVEFFHQFNDALRAGYRPCKICKPTENAHEMPSEIQQAIQLVKKTYKEKVRDQDLRDNNISPETVRRWFKKHYGVTFHSYQRMLRINQACEELKLGTETTEAAFNSGYESLSGFGYTFKKLTGTAPSQMTDTSPILLHRFTTPLGPMFAAASEQGLCLLEFVERRMLETEFKDLQRLLKAPIHLGENTFTVQAQQEITEYFAGERQKFNVKLHTPGTPFQQKVWQILNGIPYGETQSYQQQAIDLGKPSAVRAVASANGQNRVAIIIPCHRVIGKNGKLTGYAGGLERKRWLLEHEKKLRKN